MSSTTTAVPSGTINEWCIQALHSFDTTDPNTCAASNSTLASAFQTICCDGQIIDTTSNLWGHQSGQHYLNLTNLLCCRIQGPQQGGLQPIPQNNGLTCTAGTSTPLASLAATNIKNAQDYLATFTSASFGSGSVVGDYIPTETPTCLWADTAHGVLIQSVTLPAAQIETLAPATTDFEGLTVTSTDQLTTATGFSGSDARSSAKSSSTTSAANGFIMPQLKWLVLLGFNLLGMLVL